MRNFLSLFYSIFSQVKEGEGYVGDVGLKVYDDATWVGLLQLVPAEEGSFLLLTEVRSLL